MTVSNENLVPPGGSPEQLFELPAPDVSVRGFLDTYAGQKIPPEVTIPASVNNKPMSPIETSTGVALAIIAPIGRKSDRHHAHFYERSYINGTEGQEAVRRSRLQRANQYVHRRYHVEFDGTAFPETSAEEYEITLLNCAGYIPQFGARFKDNGFVINELSNRERKKLRREHALTQERHSDVMIGKFLLGYAMEQDLGHVKELHIEEFLSITSEQMEKSETMRNRRLWLANELTDQAIDAAVDPINPIFCEAHKARKLRIGTPTTALEVAKQLVNIKLPNHFYTVEDKLSARFS